LPIIARKLEETRLKSKVFHNDEDSGGSSRVVPEGVDCAEKGGLATLSGCSASLAIARGQRRFSALYLRV
jgi:hypothetical protein